MPLFIVNNKEKETCSLKIQSLIEKKKSSKSHINPNSNLPKFTQSYDINIKCNNIDYNPIVLFASVCLLVSFIITYQFEFFVPTSKLIYIRVYTHKRAMYSLWSYRLKSQKRRPEERALLHSPHFSTVIFGGQNSMLQRLRSPPLFFFWDSRLSFILD